MALPIPIVVDNFADYYTEQKKIEAVELKQEAKVTEVKTGKVVFALPRLKRLSGKLNNTRSS